MTTGTMTNAGRKPLITFLSNDSQLLVALALASVLIHTIFNHQYGFHRDELATIDDARHLAWGYVAYPPLAPFVARIAFEFFGSSLTGLRLFSASALGVAVVLTGLMARSLGGLRFAQLTAAAAVAVSPIVIASGSLFQYVSFDYLWWTCIAFMTIKLRQSGDARWWLGIGAAIGIGMLTKYTVAFLVIGLVAGVVATEARQYLKSPWLWSAVLLSIVIWLPNLIWQAEHQFISIDFLRSIHERDVEIGRTQCFLIEQFFICTNLLTVPLWLAGFCFYLKNPAGARYRIIAWMFAVPLILFFLMQGRSYYFAPAYPMLFAAGGVWCERWINSLPNYSARRFRVGTIAALFLGGVVFGALLMPIAPVNSPLWKASAALQDNFTEEIGWQELVDEVANVYNALPAEEKAGAGILAGNYGEAGAINLYGPNRGLPKVISLINSYWLQGYGEPPKTLIVIGFSSAQVGKLFDQCEIAGQITNQFGIENEESRDHRNIFICRRLRQPWKEFWKNHRSFG